MAEPPKIQWTTSQQKAIETIGRKVLVTASAGTGKTAVLSHRVVERIYDAVDPVQADRMLVLTFTDAAAEEMRSRIAETLYKRYLQTREPRLRQQLLLLDRAYISTIHAFCKRVLTEFFYLIGLDPAFGILDADEQQLLKAELLEETLEDAWADEKLAGDLENLFAGRRVQPGTRSFVDLIIPLTEFLESVVDRDEFYASAAKLCQEGDQPHAVLAEAQKKILLDKLNQCSRQLQYALSLDAEYCQGQYASAYIQDTLLPATEQAVVLLEQDRFDLCGDHIEGLDFGRMPNFKKKEWPEHAKDLIKAPVDHAKEQMKKMGDFALLCRQYQSRLAPQAALQTEALLKLMQLFEAHYARAKQLRNVLDFADLEHHVLRLLKEHPHASETLTGRFKYIFVDEYQDINAPQQRILEWLSRPDNVFVVGDIKQSIYGFRQSKPDIFLSQLETAKEITKQTRDPGRVDLKDNFRCRPEVISFVNDLFQGLMTRSVAQMDYDERAELVNGFHYPPFQSKDGPGKPVELFLLDEENDAQDADEPQDTSTSETGFISAAQRQAAWIAKRIQKIVGCETGSPEFQVYDKTIDAFRDVQYRDIVILMRSLSHKAQDYTEMLRLARVPVHSQSACGYFETTEIADCISMLKVLDNPDRDIELAALLRSPVFGVIDSQLLKIRLHTGNEGGFYRAIHQYAADGPESDLADKLKQVLSTIHDWRRQVRTGSLADFLDSFFRQTGLLSFYAALPNGSQRCANLLKLHDHAIQFEHFRTTEPGSALVRFVQFLRKLEEAEQDWAPAEPGSSSENAVRLMSIHKSKGLEFPVVFVAELNSRFNMRDRSGECLIDEDMLGLQIVDKDLRVRFPSMAHQIIAERKTSGTLAEEMRILYVALTRAREKLILTGSKKSAECHRILTRCARFAGSLPDWQLTDMRCHLDWILAGLAKESSLHDLFETGVVDGLMDSGLFYCQLVPRDGVDSLTREILNSKRFLESRSGSQNSGSLEDCESEKGFESICRNLGWNYRFDDVTRMPAKLSVSELTHRDDEFFAVNTQRGFEVRPQATVEKQPAITAKSDALSLGSAYHTLIEHLDLTSPIDEQAVRSTLHRLTEKGDLSHVLATAVEVSAITAFFESSLGQAALAAGERVLREWPFTYAMDNADIGIDTEMSAETMILQGIVDMVIPTDEGLVIVDFKTDRVTEKMIDERVSQYADQLRHYAQAASAILKQPVTGRWLYFITLGRAIEI